MKTNHSRIACVAVGAIVGFASLAGPAWSATVAYWRFDDIELSGSTTNLVTSGLGVRSGASPLDRMAVDEISGREMRAAQGSTVFYSNAVFKPQVDNPDLLDFSYLTTPANNTYNCCGLNQRSLFFSAASGSRIRQVSPGTTNDLADTSLDFGAGMAFTIEGWLRLGASTGTSQVFLDKRVSGAAGYRLFHDVSGYLNFFVESPGVVARVTFDDFALNDSLWHHFAAIRETTGAMRLFIDQIEDITLANNGFASNAGSTANTAPLTFGAARDGTASFVGFLDEVRFSNVALTPDQFLLPEPSAVCFLALGGLLLQRRR